MSNKIEQIIEDVEEKDLVIESEVEVSEETEVTEQEQPLSNAVLDVLLGEAKKKNEEEEDSDEEDESEDEDEDEELEEATEEDDEDSEEDEEEVSEAADEESDEEEESDEDDDSELPEVKTKAGILAASFDALKGMKKSNLVAAYEAINMSEDEGEVEVPKTKADIINAMYGQLKTMKKENLQASFKSIVSSCGVHEETEADSFAEDLKVLAEADKDLTEDFKAKASVLFEAAIADKVNGIHESLEAQYAEDLSEEVAYVRESLVEKIDGYLSYVVESFIEENQEFVDNKLRTEITEDFMSALQGVFTEHYIEVPDSKVDLVDELSEEVAEIKESLANTEAEKSELAQQVETLQREKVIAEASSDLASTQAGKLSSLVEETQFVNVETFAAKVATIKEGFFKESKEEVLSEEVTTSSKIETQTIVEGVVNAQAKLPKDMAKYVQHLSRFK